MAFKLECDSECPLQALTRPPVEQSTECIPAIFLRPSAFFRSTAELSRPNPLGIVLTSDARCRCKFGRFLFPFRTQINPASQNAGRARVLFYAPGHLPLHISCEDKRGPFTVTTADCARSRRESHICIMHPDTRHDKTPRKLQRFLFGTHRFPQPVSINNFPGVAERYINHPSDSRRRPLP